MANHANPDIDLDPDINYFNDLYDSLNNTYNSNYFDSNSFNESIKTLNNNMVTLINFNIRSFNKNYIFFESFLETLDISPDVIILSETWLKDENKHLANIEGYDASHTTRDAGIIGGGTSIFYKNKHIAKHLESLTIMNNNIETCAIELNMKDQNNIVFFYLYIDHLVDQ